MTIYDKDKLDDNIHIQKKTPNPQIYMLCEMGAELEEVVDGIIGETGTVGTDTKPIKLVEGVATPVTNDLVDTATNQDVDGTKNFLVNPKGAAAESGAVDTSIINANWVSQTGTGRPNNLMHATGNEEFSGVKKAAGTGFIRKKSASLDLGAPTGSTSITDETYVMEDIHGETAVQMFNSFSPNAQTIYHISSKFPFVDTDDSVKVTSGVLWLATYKDKATLFIRFIDKDGNTHLKTIATVSEND